LSRIAFNQCKGLLTALLLFLPGWAHAQPQAVPAVPSVSAASVRTISDEAFQRWLKEDTQVVNGILATLTQIDILLADIERMVRQLPDYTAAPKPAPAAAPLVTEKRVVEEVEVSAPLSGWLPTLSSAALAALLAFWLGRKQGAKQSIGKILAESAQPTAPIAAERRSSAPEATPVVTRVTAPAVTTPPETSATHPTATVPSPTGIQPTPIEPAQTSIEPAVSGETDQAIELAEIMLSMGLGHGAAQTLVEKIRSEPKQALRHWLKLLEIYRKNGQQTEFERSAEELRLHFNVRPEDWHPQPNQQRTLESFPHIVKRLTELWGTADCLVYMQNLLADNRGGTRSGFPQAVAEELLMLINVMRAAYFGQ